MPHAGDWKEGAKITGYGTPPIKPGTAIATFTDGAYKNQITDNHAAIFLGYMTKGGLKGISVIDQYDNKDHHGPADIRFIPMTKQPHPKYWATKFSVIAVGLSSHKK